MNYDQYTIKAQDALQQASVAAQQEDHSEVGTEHLLLALLQQEDGIVPPLVERIGADITYLTAEAERLVQSNPKIHGNAAQLHFSPAASKALAKAEKEAAGLKDEYLSTEHIFIALSESDDKTGEMLKRNGINRNVLLQALKSVRGNQRVTNQDPEATFQALEKYCRDLTALAR
ncbi:MAG: type VI secretion system ATPase TssH, partial [Spirochaetaceae bacterium]|nr:type VI secretion system ATPase TssH [Spirochaetaceae bacterium]